MQENPNWKKWHTALFFLFLLGTPIIVLWLCKSGCLRAAWITALILLIAFLLVAASGITGHTYGVLIDERNKMSLSRFQAVAWTIMVLSAFLASAFWNIENNMIAPLSIAVPPELWVLMGISATSLVGSPLIKSTKKEDTPNDKELAQTKEQLNARGINKDQVEAKGVLAVNTDPNFARWADLFSGEEVGNAARLELSKVQMFYFTLVLLVAYAAMLWHSLDLSQATKMEELPAFDQGMLALLGISHAAYLANKAVPHSQKSDT
jgi:hypothetical protein